MRVQQAKAQFIQTWARMGVEWGINRTMAQVHALLLVTPDALSTDEVMEALSISRGNANMNLRELANWTLIYRETKPGDRKEYFRAEKDVWEMAKRIARERKKREIEPILRDLVALEQVEGTDAETREFRNTVKNIRAFATRIDTISESVLKLDELRFFNSIRKLF